MNKFRFTMIALAIMAFTLMVSSSAQAQATRTWVSGVGDDVNPCSRTAPCKTFAGAISKTAAGGEIDALDPGGFGAVTVTKSITIDGTTGAGFGGILSASVNGVVVNDGASATPNTAVVNIRNLSIQGTGPSGTNPGLNGIRFVAGKSLAVEGCIINGFTTAANNGNGIDVAMTNATAAEVYVRNTTIQNCRVGIRLTQPSGFLVAGITGVNIGHMSLDGIQVQANSIADIRDTTIAFATGTGINYSGAASASLGMSIVNSTVAHCATGVAVGGSTSRITHSALLQNSIGVSFGGGSLRSFGDNVYDNSTNFSGGAISPQGQQ
jgi:parallel beta helix pectate lyase-like protein